MILHRVNRQLRQREETDFEKYGIDDTHGISYDTPDE